ncbi:tyrosine-type recombinase/integrase [Tunicatimonas pelagia]|uniref:tyrosine-type recombinase/integrase n=1 Tax=Tunicatimonas pelagia TaxID=931531 RepID=UPI002665A709|nr:tyrosine-type recombinase/integrase [Tunicatimonas pelagia]WKN45300.1 tyrosine-type recombinase/integrase [Tunicatimonas pelagia]WKN45309.1 tyrosine-type recombinase/integrase [Tunicatimonas pelagia]
MPLNQHYHQRLLGFAEWLQAMNYAQVNQAASLRHTQEFLVWLQENNLTQLSQVDSQTVRQFFRYCAQRPNKTRGGSLSLNTLRKYRNALVQLSRYLRDTGQGSLEVSFPFRGYRSKPERLILSKAQVQRLYDAADQVEDPGVLGHQLLALRDRAILSLCYGCGLRRNEALQLHINDVLLERGLLHVRAGKNYTERYVPMASGVVHDLQQYLQLSRPRLLRHQSHHGLLLGWQRGKPLCAVSAGRRLHHWCQVARLPPMGLHALRHSIATHLFESGMKLEHIARFLGHRSLEATQIYTHIQPNISDEEKSL